MFKMLRIVTMLIVVGLLCGVTSATKPTHQKGHHSMHMKRHMRHRMRHHHMHWRHHSTGPVTAQEHSTMLGPTTDFDEYADGWWMTDSGDVSNPDVVNKVNSDSDANLNEFGTGIVASADLVRFTKPSMVVNNSKATNLGLRGDRKPNWNSTDEAKEGSFIADYQSMLLRSFAKDHK